MHEYGFVHDGSSGLHIWSNSQATGSLLIVGLVLEESSPQPLQNRALRPKRKFFQCLYMLFLRLFRTVYDGVAATDGSFVSLFIYDDSIYAKILFTVFAVWCSAINICGRSKNFNVFRQFLL